MSDHEHVWKTEVSGFFGGPQEKCELCGVHKQTAERYADKHRINLTHCYRVVSAEGCYGILEAYSSIGQWKLFRCSECQEEVVVEPSLPQLEAHRQKQEEDRRQHEERMKTWVPPTPTGRMPTQEEAELLAAYREWSEDAYAAGFMNPDEATVRQFIEHRDKEQPDITQRMWDYEEEFLRVYKEVMKE